MNLQTTFAVLKPDLSVEAVPLSPELYTELDARFDKFRSHILNSAYRFEADWSTWERHPAGDEVVVLLSGSATLIMRRPDGDEAVELAEPGATIIVPRNTWHTARISEPARMLFITPGEGTENEVDP